MDIALFITLLAFFSVITGLCTEGCKKVLDEIKVSYSSNILVLIVACVVGIGGTAAYYIIYSVEFNAINVVFMILMGFACSLCAMVSYDKVVQTIAQLKNKM